MDVKTAAALRRMRIISVAEAVSFLVLLIFGSLLSRISSVNLLMPLGMLHGVLFVIYLVLLADVWNKAKWNGKRVALFVLFAVLPTGGFFGDRKLRAEAAATPVAAADPAVDSVVGA
ncbi:DUF3817 domain-containing protein [Streptomyces sp. SL13]|uniref:DUF3817 domain-containing protein n=1 Tax=Streptantibioticus silvisoli TaxID=2705255 RepID=A0AA90GZW7_9ACTN|nr:DUF3817 domain-containing protein [Streptantibioticus silvisoli]MDI5962713.1 DUF3817 domain-containing protein [Streptantibioticus silvisoli]MDI5968314.1 DUF3817 domain-containing protein [Streptantibioticus silvisoli]